MDSTTEPSGGATPVATTKAVPDFGDAIRKARFSLSGALDAAIVRLKEASRLATQVKNPHAHELAYLAGELEPVFETVQLVEMCLVDLFPEQ